MKRKRADRVNWQRVTKRRFAIVHLETPEFTGALTLLQMNEVSEPLLIDCQGKRDCIVNNGYSWLQHFPLHTRYTLTTIFDEHGELVRWYVDICKQHGIDPDGVPWYEDLYLDIDILPSGEAFLLDANELDVALSQQLVTSIEYEIAWREANSIMEAVEADRFPLLWESEEHHKMMLQRLPD